MSEKPRVRAMFTGLVQDIGTIRSAQDQEGGKRLVIETQVSLNNVSIGASICCSGICLTVVKIDGSAFTVDVSAETLSKTNLSEWQDGARVNIEPSMRLGDEVGGHFVFGHVDAIAALLEVKADGGSHRLKVKVPAELAQYIAPKGSVSLDGVSLTVNDVENDVFGVNIIPHTWEKTTLGLKKPGDTVNIEIDMLARYAARILAVNAA